MEIGNLADLEYSFQRRGRLYGLKLQRCQIQIRGPIGKIVQFDSHNFIRVIEVEDYSGFNLFRFDDCRVV